MRAVNGIRLAVLSQRGHLFAWVPVCLGVGIGSYFALRSEPAIWQLGVVAFFGAALCWVALREGGAVLGVPIWGVALVCFGFSLAGTRAHLVAGPVLVGRYFGPIEGRIVGIDRSASDALRLTLDRVHLSGKELHETPLRVRVALHGTQNWITPTPGLRVGLTGHLAPPSGPVEPNGFDFQRHAWFQHLGAVGYTRSPALEMAPSDARFSVFSVRLALSNAIQERMDRDVSGFAAAVTTGDRSGIPLATVESLRAANLAHLLAISGLHMGLLAGFVFASVRVGLALMPAIALRINTRKVAAGVALLAAAGYLALSGGSVSTERAFVMTAVMLSAVLVDRRALSIRAVALAAVVVLVLRPEALLGPGFQMSFAATLALVLVFGSLRDRDVGLGPRWLRPVAAVFISSLVAGLATAPFAAFHFNQVAHYGLPANLLSVPVMGLIVVPSAVAAGLLAPLGLEQLGLWPMGLGLRWILAVAEITSGLDGARGVVPSPDPLVLPIMSLGALWLGLWQGRSRLAGAFVILFALGLWQQAERPMVLISDTGALVGVMTDQGRALSRRRGQGFVAKNWLENDGVALDQASAANLWPGTQEGLWRFPVKGGGTVIHAHGKRGLSLFDGCQKGDIVVFSENYDRKLPCDTYDPHRLKSLGAVAITLENGLTSSIFARQVSGRRIWNTRSGQRRAPDGSQ